MHMADALVSAPVAITAGVAATALVVVAARKISKSTNESIVPLMGVLGAFIFAAQMINFSIPGTGSSGHIVGGILLSALLGPWAGFMTLVSVLIIQCLVFADGGLMALGCNILNMVACSCLVAYPLIYRPLMRYPASLTRIIGVTALASVAALELGAMFVTLETELSGVTALPTGKFLLFMLPIHLVIGICEGLATAAVIYFVQRYRPALVSETANYSDTRSSVKGGLVAFLIATVVLAAGFSWIASSNPDGLEWSIMKVAGTELEITDVTGMKAEVLQNKTAILPDYESRLSGIIGAVIVMSILWSVSTIIVRRHKLKENRRCNEK